MLQDQSPQESEGGVLSVEIHHDGTSILVATRKGFYLWKEDWLKEPSAPAALLAQRQAALPYRIGGQGELEFIGKTNIASEFPKRLGGP